MRNKLSFDIQVLHKLLQTNVTLIVNCYKWDTAMHTSLFLVWTGFILSSLSNKSYNQEYTVVLAKILMGHIYPLIFINEVHHLTSDAQYEPWNTYYYEMNDLCCSITFTSFSKFSRHALLVRNLKVWTCNSIRLEGSTYNYALYSSRY